MFRHTLHHHYVSQRLDHLGARPAPFRTHQQAFPGVLIDQVQYPHRPSIMGLGAHEVVAPDMVRVLGAQSYARPVVEPQPASWLLLLRNLQPLTTPDSLHPILADGPACSSQECCDASIAIAPILARYSHDRSGEFIFIVPLCRSVALSAAWLLHHQARTPLAQPMCFTRMAHRTATPFRA